MEASTTASSEKDSSTPWHVTVVTECEPQDEQQLASEHLEVNDDSDDTKNIIISVQYDDQGATETVSYVVLPATSPAEPGNCEHDTEQAVLGDAFRGDVNSIDQQGEGRISYPADEANEHSKFMLHSSAPIKEELDFDTDVVIYATESVDHVVEDHQERSETHLDPGSETHDTQSSQTDSHYWNISGKLPVKIPAKSKNKIPKTARKKKKEKIADEKKNLCEFCEKSFRRPSDLQRHNRVHTGEKPYQCSQCGKSFRQQDHVRTHELRHTGETPFACYICEKAFTRQSYLQKHLVHHRGQIASLKKARDSKCHRCSSCGRQYQNMITLNTHRTITRENPLKQCKYCNLELGKNCLKFHQGLCIEAINKRAREMIAFNGANNMAVSDNIKTRKKVPKNKRKNEQFRVSNETLETEDKLLDKKEATVMTVVEERNVLNKCDTNNSAYDHDYSSIKKLQCKVAQHVDGHDANISVEKQPPKLATDVSVNLNEKASSELENSRFQIYNTEQSNETQSITSNCVKTFLVEDPCVEFGDVAEARNIQGTGFIGQSEYFLPPVDNTITVASEANADLTVNNIEMSKEHNQTKKKKVPTATLR